MDERGGTTFRVRVTLLGALRVHVDPLPAPEPAPHPGPEPAAAPGPAAAPEPEPEPESVALTGARLRGLLVRLAIGAGRPVDVGTLVDGLWPQSRPADPTNALQSLVSRLRRALGPADAVRQVPGGYRLAVGDDDVDAVRFERLAAQGRARLHAGDPAAASEALRQAEGLWGGPVAAEVAAVAPAAAVRLTHARTEVAADRAEADLLVGRHAEVAGRLPALLAEHPQDERVAALLMDALIARGRQTEALAVYEAVRRALADELGVDPGAALRERHLRALRPEPGPAHHSPAGQDFDGRTPTDPARTDPVPADPAPTDPASARADPATSPSEVVRPSPTRLGNLPATLTSFIGRDEDLARVEALLQTGRLVTILGPGGAGKTRLAVEAGSWLRGRYRDGAWLVDLASVTEPTEIISAMVSALDLRSIAPFDTRAGRAMVNGRDDLESLIEQLAGREQLLIVDNCEHLIESVARTTAALLTRCPHLHVLATSRELLAVDGEALVPLGPLRLPPADADVGTATVAPSVRLFVERAAAVRPGFAVDGDTVRDVVEVVRRLDGLPLALELAAARLRTLPLAELAAGLSDRFRLLTGGNRTALPRNRTLRAVIAWSWDLLGADERVLVDRIGVLPGGVTPESAAAVCAGSAIAADRVPDLLAGLVDRSLLQLVGAGPRYRMLETLREYGAERLVERGELTAVRELAARHIAALLERTDPMLRTAEQLPAMRLMHDEYDNALAALRHLCDSGDSAAATHLALSLCWYWQMVGRHSEARFWLGEVLAVPGEVDALALDCAQAIFSLSALGNEPFTESLDDQRRRLRGIAGRLAGHGELAGLAGVLAAVVLAFAGDADEARQHIENAVAGDNVWLSALARLFRARLAENNGDVAQVRADAELALAGFQSVGDRWGQLTALPLRALTRQYAGDLDGALSDLHTARALSQEFGSLDVNDEIFLDLRAVDLYLRRGEPEQVEAALRAARSRAERSTSLEMMFLVDVLHAGARAAQNRLDEAQEMLERAAAGLLPEGWRLAGGDHGVAIFSAVAAGVAFRRGELGVAEQHLIRAYGAALESRDMPIIALVAVGAAGLAQARDQHHDAAQLLGAAARLRGAEDPTDLQIADLTRRCRAALGDEEFDDAYAGGWSLDATAAATRVDPGRRPARALDAAPATGGSS